MFCHLTWSKIFVLAGSMLLWWSLFSKLAPLRTARSDALWEEARASIFGQRKASLVPDGWLQASVSPLFRIEDNQRCLFMTLFIGNKFAWTSEHTQLIISACMFSTRKTKVLFEITLVALSGPKGVWLIYCHHPPFGLDFIFPFMASWKQAPTLLWSSAELGLRPSWTFEKLLFLYIFVATLFCFSACYPRERNIHEVQEKEKDAQNQ